MEKNTDEVCVGQLLQLHENNDLVILCTVRERGEGLKYLETI